MAAEVKINIGATNMVPNDKETEVAFNGGKAIEAPNLSMKDLAAQFKNMSIEEITEFCIEYGIPFAIEGERGIVIEPNEFDESRGRTQKNEKIKNNGNRTQVQIGDR